MTSLIRDLSISTPEMLDAFGDEALVRAALDFEKALAFAQAAEGLLSDEEAVLIARACATPFDLAELASAAAHAGTLAIPLVAELRARVAKTSSAAASKVHLGATSQDVADTALMLQARTGGVLIRREADRCVTALADLAERHAGAPMLGRTLLQPARPITFGLKAAGWLLAVDAASRRFDREAEAALLLQFGGAAGALEGLDGKGDRIAAHMAEILELACPPIPWHARRDGVAGLASALAILTGVLGKIAIDVALLSQAEISEVFEPRAEGRGGSSSMFGKRNPTGCQVVRSAALSAPHFAATILSALPQELERGLGGWQAEGVVLADLFGVAHGALAAMADVLEGLEVGVERMTANLAAANVGQDTGEAARLTAQALTAWRADR